MNAGSGAVQVVCPGRQSLILSVWNTGYRERVADVSDAAAAVAKE